MAPTTLMQRVTPASNRASIRRSAPRRVAVSVHAHQRRTSRGPASNVAPAVLAALVSLTSGFTPLDIVMPSPAQAQEEEEALTPYERRQRDLAKRRELLKQAREKALEKSSGVDETTTLEADAKVEASNAERRSTAEELKESLQLKTSLYEQQASKRKAAPPPAPAPETPAAEAPTPSPFSFSAPKPAPPPAAVAPPPAFAPVVVAPVKAPAPAPSTTVPAKAPAPAPAASKKRRGPLPTFLAELLVLGLYAGIFTAITKYNAQVTEATAAAKGVVISLYEKVEKALPSGAK